VARYKVNSIFFPFSIFPAMIAIHPHADTTTALAKKPWRILVTFKEEKFLPDMDENWTASPFTK